MRSSEIGYVDIVADAGSIRRLVVVTEDVEPLYGQFAELFGLPLEHIKKSPVGVAGTVASICEQLEERRERWGFSYIVIHEGEIEAFAPVVAALAGR